DIENSIGKYIRAVDSSIKMEQMVYARMCVYMDINQPLPAKIMLEIGEDKWEQQIDYENIPFRCRFCYKYGHLVKDCPQRMKEQNQEQPSSDDFIVPPKRKTVKEKNTGKTQQHSTNRFAALQSDETKVDMEEEQETQVLETQDVTPPQHGQDNPLPQSVSKALVVHSEHLGDLKSYRRKHKLTEEHRKEELGNGQNLVVPLFPSFAEMPPDAEPLL
ncbi:hypothetical protein KI387_040577, partial [Taxus chinensis]